MKKIGVIAVLTFAGGSALAFQTYVPPPPPRLPAMLSEKMVAMGKDLFENNLVRNGRIEIRNYLGAKPCATCHDKPNPLVPDRLAPRFAEIRTLINAEIVKYCGGTELSPQDPAMEALVQYIVDRYKLYDFKLSK
ncbi:MAG: hypothetical protein V1798_12325 [Pseudomonadota bacterium]